MSIKEALFLHEWKDEEEEKQNTTNNPSLPVDHCFKKIDSSKKSRKLFIHSLFNIHALDLDCLGQP